MIFEEMMKNEYKMGHEDGLKEGIDIGKNDGIIEGKIEDIIYFLYLRFEVSDELSKKLHSVKDENAVSKLLILRQG